MSLTDSEFTRLIDLIYRHAGMRFDERRREYRMTRLNRRAKEAHCGDPSEYLRLIQRDDRLSEFKLFIASITTNETYFFREYTQLECFADHILPAIVEAKRRQGDYSLKLWSAACSTGEEAYTLAIILRECLEDFPKWTIRILATDISERVLITARQAVYEGRTLQYIPEPYFQRHFTRQVARQEGEWQVVPETRALVQFENLNFMDPGPMKRHGDMDFIFVRNVLIYFDEQSRKQVLTTLHRALLPEGWIFVGHSETLNRYEPLFQSIRVGGQIQYRKKV